MAETLMRGGFAGYAAVDGGHLYANPSSIVRLRSRVDIPVEQPEGRYRGLSIENLWRWFLSEPVLDTPRFAGRWVRKGESDLYVLEGRYGPQGVLGLNPLFLAPVARDARMAGKLVYEAISGPRLCAIRVRVYGGEVVAVLAPAVPLYPDAWVAARGAA